VIGSRRGVLGGGIAGALVAALGAMTPNDGEASSKSRKRKTPKRRRRKRRNQGNDAPRLESAFRCEGTSTTQLSGVGARIGQTFTATSDGSLREVRIGIVKNAGSVGDYVVQLIEVDGANEQDHTALGVLAVATNPDGSAPDGASTLVAEFDGPELTTGTEYGVVLARPNSTQLAVQVLDAPQICLGTAVRADDAEDEFLVINFDVVDELVE
jgi:hypothetical protein